VAADEGDGLVFVQLGALANDPFEGVIAELGACSVDAVPPLAAVVLDVAGLEDADPSATSAAGRCTSRYAAWRTAASGWRSRWFGPARRTPCSPRSQRYELPATSLARCPFSPGSAGSAARGTGHGRGRDRGGFVEQQEGLHRVALDQPQGEHAQRGRVRRRLTVGPDTAQRRGGAPPRRLGGCCSGTSLVHRGGPTPVHRLRAHLRHS
jgi:hypothetical protein